MSRPAKLDFSIQQGDDEIIELAIVTEDTNGNEIPRDMTGYTFKSQMRRSYKSDEFVEFTFVYDNSVYTDSTADLSIGRVDMRLSDTQTDLLDPDRIYQYDIKAIDSEGLVSTIISGNIDILPEITQGELGFSSSSSGA